MGRAVGVRVGAITQTTAKAVLVCATPDATTFTVNGTPYAVSWAMDTSATYFLATIDITGLSAFANNTWTVTQGASSNSGSFRSAPRATDDFTLFFYSCYSNTGHPTVNGNGAFNYIRSYQQNGRLPVAAILPSDDMMYIDAIGGGVPAISWGVWYGMDAAYDDLMFPDHIPALENSAVLPMWGDHEFSNNLKAGDAPTPNAYHATPGGYNGDALVAYEEFVKPLQGPSIGVADVQANHWGIDLGPLLYVTTDGITRASTTAWLGNNQIDDVLKRMSESTQPLKLLSMYNEPRAIGVSGVFDKTETMLNDFPAEYQRLFIGTGNPYPSISQSLRTNGADGVTVVVKGDNHSGDWKYLQAPGGGALRAESIMICNCSPARGTWHGGTIDLSMIGTIQNNARIHWQSNKILRAACLQIDVYGSLNEMVVKQVWNTGSNLSAPYTWTTAVERKFAPFTGNEGVIATSRVKGRPQAFGASKFR